MSMAVLLRPQNRGLVLTAVVLVVAIGGAAYGLAALGRGRPCSSADYAVTPDADRRHAAARRGFTPT